MDDFQFSNSRSAQEAFMYRMTSIQCGISTHLGRQLNYATPLRPPRLVSRSLHTSPISNNQTRRSKLKAYTGSAIALGLLSLGTYLGLYPSQTTSHSALHERRFQPFAIVSKEPVSSNSSIYTLRPSSQHASDPYTPLWARGIWFVEFKQPQLQIARSYTPLPPTDPPSVPGDLSFLIRREQHGEVSTYLDRLMIGAIVDIRGPKVEYEVPDGVSEVVFLAGGTGIAPALQVAYTLLNTRAGDGLIGKPPRIHIFWANRRREDCAGARRTAKSSWWSWGHSVADETSTEAANMIVRELQQLEKKFEGRVRVDYMVDEGGSFIGKSDILKVTSHSVTSSQGVKPAESGAKLLLIAGPDGFVDYYAGPRELENGRLGQGRLGGMLGSLALKDWTVVKL